MKEEGHLTVLGKMKEVFRLTDKGGELGDRERHLKRLDASLLMMPTGIKHFTSSVNPFVLMP